ncbi:MAG: glycosyltransferase family 4 protein [Thermodesulfobacteriota bacterium]
MKISFFNYHYDIEGSAIGAATQIRAITAALTRLGHQVDLQFRTPKPPGKDREYLGFKKIQKLRRFGHVPRIFLRNFGLIREEFKLLDRFRPDVVLAVSSFVNFSALVATRRRGLPLVLFAEAPLEYEYRLFYPQYYRYPWLTRWVEGVNVRGAHQVVCISEILKGYLMRYEAPAAKLHVIPNGVDHFAFVPREPDPEFLASLRLEGRVVIGYIGSFEFFSNIKMIITLARKIIDADSRVVFLFVGKGRVDDALRHEAEATGLGPYFIFTGGIPHNLIPRLLSVMDIVISPYKEDYLFYGSSMKLLEYMAAGKAVLFPALGQIKELVCDGCNGRLYEPGDREAMASKLLELIAHEDLRRRLGARARQTIENNWTWDIQGRRLARVLELARKSHQVERP